MPNEGLMRPTMWPYKATGVAKAALDLALFAVYQGSVIFERGIPYGY